jgi:hypothetical protein
MESEPAVFFAVKNEMVEPNHTMERIRDHLRRHDLAVFDELIQSYNGPVVYFPSVPGWILQDIPKLIYPIAELKQLNRVDDYYFICRVCVSCFIHTTAMRAANTVADGLCEDCWAESRKEIDAFPVKMLLIRSLPLLPELAAAIIALM